MRIAFPLQQWLHERASMLRYTYIVRHVHSIFALKYCHFEERSHIWKDNIIMHVKTGVGNQGLDSPGSG